MLLSIIIPVFNVEDYIIECFESIIKQNLVDTEIICIDDGSTDMSGTICDKYAQNNKIFNVMHIKNSGVSVARNLGLTLAKGKYVAWIDPDDFITDDWFEKVKGCLERSEIDVLVFDYYKFRNNAIDTRRYKVNSCFLNKERFLYDLVEDTVMQSHLWNKIFKSSLFKDIKFPESISCMEDYAILHQLIENSNRIYYLSNPLYFYRIREGSLVNLYDVEKGYERYKIAKRRYEYLISKYKGISKIGYLKQLLSIGIEYNRMEYKDAVKYRCYYDDALKIIKEDIWFILFQSNETFVTKLKYLMLCSGTVKFALRIKDRYY